jgi:signal recognition particle subunit SRP72
LRKALEVCVQFYQDQQQGGDAEDLEDSRDEIERETSSIRVQLAYCLQLQGGTAREKEAQALNNAVLKAKVSEDVALVAVASNNLVTLNRDQNIFDSKKRMKAAMAAVADGMEHKMPKAHRRLISKNNALLAMYTNQVNNKRDQRELVLYLKTLF